MNWATADHHWGHRNIIQYCNRPFDNEDHMDQEMRERWNSVVRPNDHVYHLGDFTLGIRAWWYAEQLNGIIHVIPGGHDKRWIRYNEYDPAKIIIEPPLLTVSLEGRRITMCHYPLRSWEQSHYGAHHFHGHCHGTIGVMDPSDDRQLPPGQKRGKRIDVGVDNWSFYPMRVSDLLGILEAPDA